MTSLAIAAAGIAAIIFTLTGTTGSVLGLFVASAAVPLAVLTAVHRRLGLRLSLRPLLRGATIGPILALGTSGLLFGISYWLVLSSADIGSELINNLPMDPDLALVAGSPWIILLLVQVALIAPLTEEIAKTIAARPGRSDSRAGAFAAGVSAGVGFAVVENCLYAFSAILFEWEIVVVARMIGAAVHPLATGLVAMGWWEWKQKRDGGALLRRFLAGAGVHAIWNGSLVALFVLAETYGISSLDELAALNMAFMAMLGVIAAGILWSITGSLREGAGTMRIPSLSDARTLAAWSILSASLLVPITLLLFAYPQLGNG